MPATQNVSNCKRSGAIPTFVYVGDCHREHSWRCFGPQDGPCNGKFLRDDAVPDLA
jgi:hypothetical protein